jgi:prepilin-type N-terminal cleavage/methylation domain-containing protein
MRGTLKRWDREKEPGQDQESPDIRAGFSIIEVLLAIMILAFGALGMAGTTLVMVKQTTLSDVTTDRAAALQSTIERIRALPFDSLTTGSDSVGDFDVSWTINDGRHWKAVEIITTGPGLSSEAGYPALVPSVKDTLNYWVLR